MRSFQNRPRWWLIFICTAIACGDGEVASQSQAGLAFARSLEGEWWMSSQLSTDCPSEVGMPTLAGSTRWVRQGDELRIGSLDGTWTASPMQAIDGQTLLHQAEYSSTGCTVSVRIEMGVEALKLQSGRGAYSAKISSDGGLSCSAYAASLGLPEACTVTGAWQVER